MAVDRSDWWACGYYIMALGAFAVGWVQLLSRGYDAGIGWFGAGLGAHALARSHRTDQEPSR